MNASRRRAAAEHRGDDRGVEHRSARGDLAHGGDEAVDVGDALLEQVAGAGRAVVEEVERDVRVGGGGQDERREVLAGGQFAQRDDRHVRAVRAGLALELRAVRRLRDDGDPVVFEQGGEAGAQTAPSRPRL